MKTFFVIICIVFMMSLGKIKAATSDDLKKLHNDLFVNKSYNKYVRPSKNLDKITNITATFDLETIESLNDKQGLLTTTGKLALTWKDELLVWDSLDYGGLQYFFIPTSQIWAPDIALWNGFSESKSSSVDSFQTRVLSNGEVDWMSYSTYKSKCKVNVKRFPFDSQECNITFVARNTPYEVGFLKGLNSLMVDDLDHNSEWKILNFKTLTYEDDMEVLITFSLGLKRKPIWIIYNMLLPILILAILDLVTFVFPAQSGEKMGFSITVFLAFAVFLTIITESLPESSDTISYVGIYLMIQLIQSAVIVVVSAVQIRIMFRSEDKPIGCLLKTLVRVVDFMAVCRCNKQHNKTDPSSVEKHELEDVHEKAADIKDEENIKWSDVSDSLDVCFFVFFGIFLFLSTIVLYLVVQKQ